MGHSGRPKEYGERRRRGRRGIIRSAGEQIVHEVLQERSCIDVPPLSKYEIPLDARNDEFCRGGLFVPAS